MSGLALYRAFEIGKMAVVAPLSASYPALTLLLSWMTGERLGIVRIAGIICTLVGAVVVAGGEKTPDESDDEAARRSGRGIGWAMLSAVGFAVLFWLLGIRVIPRVGASQTVWMIRLTSAALTTAVILVSKQSVRVPRGEVRWMVLGMGVLDTSAFVRGNLGMKMEQVAVITVLGSLYGAVTVGLADIFPKERVSRWQWTGIVTIFAGIVLISG
jgi:drug/metabolite transporter (DMT)-like permease